MRSPQAAFGTATATSLGRKPSARHSSTDAAANANSAAGSSSARDSRAAAGRSHASATRQSASSASARNPSKHGYGSSELDEASVRPAATRPSVARWRTRRCDALLSDPKSSTTSVSGSRSTPAFTKPRYASDETSHGSSARRASRFSVRMACTVCSSAVISQRSSSSAQSLMLL